MRRRLPIDDYPGAVKITVGDEYWRSFAILWEKAWRQQDRTAIFHPLGIAHDEDLIKVDLPENPVELQWEDDADTSLLRHTKIRSIFVRKEYAKLLRAIIRQSVKSQQADMVIDEGEDAIVQAHEDEDDDVCSPLNDFPLEESEQVAAIVIGNDGIGKTLFLYYVLAICLLAHREVVFQWTEAEVFVMNHRGVFKIDASFTAPVLSRHLSKGTWFLRDCSMNPGAVPMKYIRAANALSGFILQAASTRKQNIEWRKKCNGAVLLFCMAPWTLGELIAARVCQLTPLLLRSQLASFITKFGGYPRQAYGYADDIGSFEWRVRMALNNLPGAKLEKLLRRVCSLELESSNDLIAFKPVSRDPQRFTVQIATKYLFNMVFTEVKKSVDQAASKMYRYFIQNPLVYCNARYLLDRMVRLRFQKGGEWKMTFFERDPRQANKCIHWHSSSLAMTFYLAIGRPGASVVVLPVIHEPFPCVPPEEYQSQAVHHYDLEENGTLQDGFYLPAEDDQDETSLGAFMYNSREKWAIIFQVSVTVKHKIEGHMLDWMRRNGAEIIDVVAVTPPVEPEHRKVFYIDADKAELVRHVYLLTVDDIDV